MTTRTPETLRPGESFSEAGGSRARRAEPLTAAAVERVWAAQEEMLSGIEPYVSLRRCKTLRLKLEAEKQAALRLVAAGREDQLRRERERAAALPSHYFSKKSIDTGIFM